MTYNRDLQEDKERLFDSADTVRDCLELMAGMLERTTVNEPACRAAAADPQLLATDLADYLVRKGVPFRAAHHAVGAAVTLAENLGVTLDRLPLADLQGINTRFDDGVPAVFDLKKAMARRRLVGSPGSGEVRKQLARWRRKLAAD
jgi:argininosuccinate lyase